MKSPTGPLRSRVWLSLILSLLALLALLALVLAATGCQSPSSASASPPTSSAASAATRPPTKDSPAPAPASTPATTNAPATKRAATAAGGGQAAGMQVVYVVGDASQPGAEAVSRRLAALVPLPSQGLDLFLYLGDVRMTGSAKDFARYDSIWGGAGHDLRAKTASVIGNHETSGRATGWVPYWSGKLTKSWPGSLTQTDPAYYAVTVGDWKFIILDTYDPVGPGTAQYAFLVSQLKAPGFHTIVAGHDPRWSNGEHGDNATMDAAWKAMCDYGAVAYLSGHDHGSQVQPPRDRDGTVVTSGGCVQFVAAAGGAPLYPFRTSPGHSVAEWRDDTHYALLKLTLSDSSLKADFIDQSGRLLHSETFAVGTGIRAAA